jgi:hypothetical protein
MRCAQGRRVLDPGDPGGWLLNMQRGQTVPSREPAGGSVPLRRCCSVRDTDSSLDPSGCVALHGGPVGAALHNDIIAALAHHQHHER